ncbi:DeoR family transcriptional regulator [Rhizocola hellebori]|uniref:DeoR family transcriptional regulator n=1 Tax=Rhizocola hellebori TaxID=1392758 RepID=A0A8J3Q925_9ACTN|nr:dienelactone hydrolase family protein [Rhizocola hellebori]GIH05582.1 DeoR family transcriptional regulator [Rhizocola hellebori]
MTSTAHLDAAGARLDADIDIPDGARGVVLFAHGSGSSRHSPRNRMVAARLREASFGTVLADLLTAQEERVDQRTAELRFDIELLALRLTAIADILAARQLPLGLFGASTGAAAALITAAHRSDTVRAVVSRGGRPDLAGAQLPLVSAPVLLIVGGNDEPVIQLNNGAAGMLGGPCQIRVVAGATHLFAEPGALEQVADLAAQWFTRHLPSG